MFEIQAQQGESEMESIVLLPSSSTAPTPTSPPRVPPPTPKLSQCDQELRRAIDGQDLRAVGTLLTEGVSISCRDEHGMSALHHSLLRYTQAAQILAEKQKTIQEYSNKNVKNLKDRHALGECLDNIDTILDKRNQAKEIVKEILATALQRNEMDGLNYRNADGRSALYTAIQSADLEVIISLVKAGANVKVVSDAGETALHVAARCNEEILMYFLDIHRIENTLDDRRYAPIHYAVTNNAVESLMILINRFNYSYVDVKIEHGRNLMHEIAARKDFANNQRFLDFMDLNSLLYLRTLNEVDDDGDTPVSIAARLNHEAITSLFLHRGGVLSVRGENQTVIEAISTNFANPIAFFEDVFDDAVSFDEDNQCGYVKYTVLTDGEDVSQIRVIEKLASQGNSALLQHPMIESLICLKWKCLLPVFYIFVATYVVFLGTFNAFVITVFNGIDTNVRSNATLTNELSDGSCGWPNWMLVAFIYITITNLFIQECFWIYLRKWSYFVHGEAWNRLGGLGLAAAVPVVVGCSPTPDSMSWQRPLACAALLLVWLQAMLLMSRFPGWGFYAFGKVATNLLKILLKSTCFVIGFSTCFMILYKSKPPFDGPVPAFLKTVVMMSSEFDYEDLFADDHAEELRYTKPVVRLLFIIFVIFVAIVLMNFMIGVAVSDINDLNNVSNIKRLEKQVELLNNLEALKDTVLNNWWSGLRHMRFQRMMCVLANNPDKPYYVQHEEEECYRSCCQPTFSSNLRNAIFRTGKKDRQQLTTLDTLYQAVVGVWYNPNGYPKGATLHGMSLRIEAIEDTYAEIKQDLEQIQNENAEIKRALGNLKEINKRMETMEHRNDDIKQSVDEIKKLGSTMEEIKEYIKDLKCSISNKK